MHGLRRRALCAPASACRLLWSQKLMSFRNQQPRRVSESLRWNAHVVMFSSAGTPSFRACLALVSAGAAVGGVASVDVPPPPSRVPALVGGASVAQRACCPKARLLARVGTSSPGARGTAAKAARPPLLRPPPRDSAPHPPSAATPRQLATSLVPERSHGVARNGHREKKLWAG